MTGTKTCRIAKWPWTRAWKVLHARFFGVCVCVCDVDRKIGDWCWVKKRGEMGCRWDFEIGSQMIWIYDIEYKIVVKFECKKYAYVQPFTKTTKFSLNIEYVKLGHILHIQSKQNPRNLLIHIIPGLFVSSSLINFHNTCKARAHDKSLAPQRGF